MSRRLSLFPIVVSVLSLAAVGWWASHQPRPELPSGRDAIVTVLGAALVYSLGTLARAERWHRILRHSGIAALRRDSYGITTIGYMGNNVLPARAGELLRVVLMAPRAGARKRDVLASIVAERLLDVVALLMVFGVIAYATVQRASVPGQGLIFVACVVAALAMLAALLLVSLPRGRVLLERLRALALTLSGPARALLSVHGVGLLALSLGIWLLEAQVYNLVGRAVGLELGVVGALYVVALTNLFALVPAAPGYVGTFDAAVVFAVRALGHGASGTLPFLLLLRFVLFVPITVVGLAVLVGRYGGLAVYRAARLEGMRV